MSFLGYSKIDTIIDALWNVYCLLDGLMSYSLASAGSTRVSYHSSYTVTIAANLLNHERSLSYCLKTSSSTSAALAALCSWLSFAALACATEIGSSKLDLLLDAIYRVHEVDLNLEQNVFSLLCCLRSSLTSSASLLLATEKLLKLFKNVTKWSSTLSSLLLPELVVEAIKSSKPTETLSKASEWVATTTLLLLISSHSGAIINPAFSIVSKHFIRFIYLCKLLFCAITFIDIGMKFFSFLEVGLFEITCRGIPINSEYTIIILFAQNPT
jgi:hypothetical protein